MCDKCQSKAVRLLMVAFGASVGLMPTPEQEASARHMLAIFNEGEGRVSKFNEAPVEDERERILNESRDAIATYVGTMPTADIRELARMGEQYESIFSGLQEFMNNAIETRAKVGDPEAQDQVRIWQQNKSVIAAMIVSRSRGETRGGGKSDAPDYIH